MNKLIIKILLVLFGVILCFFAIDALYIAFVESLTMTRVFHSLHFILVFLGFIITYLGYKEYKYLLIK